jgi:integrase
MNTSRVRRAPAQGKSAMTNTAPTTANRTLRCKSNVEYRPREYLTEAEVERLIDAVRKRGRNGARDAAAILLAYRHRLRAAELCQLRWSQIDLKHGRLHVNRAKGGIESVHPLRGPELRALRPLQGASPYVFVTEAGTLDGVGMIGSRLRGADDGQPGFFPFLRVLFEVTGSFRRKTHAGRSLCSCPGSCSRTNSDVRSSCHDLEMIG